MNRNIVAACILMALILAWSISFLLKEDRWTWRIIPVLLALFLCVVDLSQRIYQRNRSIHTPLAMNRYIVAACILTALILAWSISFLLKEDRWTWRIIPVLLALFLCVLDLSQRIYQRNRTIAHKVRPETSVGCPGLPNLGATCFFNSAIQSLAPCTPLKLWLKSSPNISMNLVCELLKDLNEEVKAAADPSLVLNALRERGFPAPNRQQDCHELLQHLLEVIEEEEAKNDCDGAWEEHPFLGKHAVAMHCETCGYKYPEQINSFHSLTLNLVDGKGKIEELLAHYVREEVIDDVDCTKCTTKPEAEGAVGQGVAKSVYIKQLSLQVLPQCLCIHINKTSIHGTVSFEENLLLTEALEGIQRRKTYRLMSVVCHYGGLHSGHYITYRLGAGSKSRDWFYTSDLHVHQVSWSCVKASSPYMLMYCQD